MLLLFSWNLQKKSLVCRKRGTVHYVPRLGFLYYYPTPNSSRGLHLSTADQLCEFEPLEHSPYQYSVNWTSIVDEYDMGDFNWRKQIYIYNKISSTNTEI